VKEMLVLPFRVFGIAARPRSLPPEVVLFWNWLSVQSVWPTKVSHYWFRDPALPLAPLPRPCGFPLIGCRRLPFKLPTASSPRTSPSFRVLPGNTYSAISMAESSHGLLLPSAHQDPEVHFSRAKPARYVPPSGFGYPLDGFLPRVPCRFYFTPTALLGFHLRRFPLP
jgi:hypothetical protein